MPNFSYNRNIPDAPNNPSQDQPKMKVNTNSIQDLIAVDHVGFGLNDGGTHNHVQLLEQTVTPPVGLQTGFETLYSKIVNYPVLGNAGEIFFIRGTGPTQIQLTGPGNPKAAQTGYTFLPGGLILQWGLITAVSQTVTTVTFASLGAVPFPNNCFNIQTTINEGASTNAIVLNISNITPSGFNYYNTSSSTRDFYWLAIGF